MKPKIVFFSRSYQAILFPLLNSDKYESIHVTLTKAENENLQAKGINVEFCFETFSSNIDNVYENYLLTSFLSDRFLNKYKIEERQKLLKKEIAFWSAIFDRYSPLAVINEQVAIEIAEVMYIEAKKRGIKYLAWMTNPINGYFYWVSNPISLSMDERVLQKTPSEISIKISQEYINRIIEKHEKPYYILPFLNQKKIENLISSIKGIRRLIIFKIKESSSIYEDYTNSVMNFFERSIKAYFVKYDSIVDIKGFEIVLYPLHYEPEASLSYLSEFFSNQVALIENITKCLKNNQILVVKEHPAQSGMLLTSKYQLLKKKNSQLIYLPANISSYEIIKKSDLIITLTSQLGWEALILGKPVFLLGKMFYDKYPYINSFKSFEKLRTDIHNKSYIYPRAEATIEYIAKLLESSYKGMPFPCDTLYDQDNLNNIIFAIEQELGLI